MKMTTSRSRLVMLQMILLSAERYVGEERMTQGMVHLWTMVMLRRYKCLEETRVKAPKSCGLQAMRMNCWQRRRGLKET